MKRIILLGVGLLLLSTLSFAQSHLKASSVSVSTGFNNYFAGYYSELVMDDYRRGTAEFSQSNNLMLKVSVEKELNKNVSLDLNVQINGKSSFQGRTNINSLRSNSRLGCTYSSIVDGEIPPKKPDLFSNLGQIYPSWGNINTPKYRPRTSKTIDEMGVSSPHFNQLLMHHSQEDRACHDESNIHILESGSIRAWSFRAGPRFRHEENHWMYSLSPQIGVSLLQSQWSLRGNYDFTVWQLLETPELYTHPTEGWTRKTTHKGDSVRYAFPQQELKTIDLALLLSLDQQLGIKYGDIAFGFFFTFQTSSQFILKNEIELERYFDIPTNVVHEDGMQFQFNRRMRWATYNHGLFLTVDLR